MSDKSVLVVEDIWQVAQAMKLALEHFGMQVVGPTSNVADARKLVASQKPDVAIIDVNLKGELASDLIDELHEQGIRVIAVSGYAQPQINMAHVSAFLQKPFS